MIKKWIKSGDPMIWLNAAAVSTSLIIVIGLLIMIGVRGLGHFWPKAIMETTYTVPENPPITLVGELHEQEDVKVKQLNGMGFHFDPKLDTVTRYLVKTGNRDVLGTDFRWVIAPYMSEPTYPEALVAIERREWGNFYGYLRELKQDGKIVATTADADLWDNLQQRIDRAQDLFDQIHEIEKSDIGLVNSDIEKLRLAERRLDLANDPAPEKRKTIAAERKVLQKEYQALQDKLVGLYKEINRDSLSATVMDGKVIEIPLAKVVRATKPNAMNVLQKTGMYFVKLWEFVSDEPREANTEGGIFPAIFGTVMMVLIMSMLVTPFGVIAAVYLREYAKQGPFTRTIRIAVNNLAGVPSIVYGVFGLGFFVYFLGGNIDRLFYPEALPSPTFGTPGILWSSLTLAILTVPVVIVATEEGLSRIPRAIREGSLALGATKAETLWRTVLPMATPAMMTGMILAIARAAGEVAPLMLVGVVKLAPSLPVDASAPFIHLERKFMHLGFHIYDVGFQSPNVEAARPLVYATALLLVAVIVLLNLAAIYIRNRLREQYRGLEH